MKKPDEDLHYASMQRFIALANEMGKEDIPKRVISAALMTASCIYSTYTEVGNEGTLDEAGVNRIAEGYRKHLQHTQKIRNENNQKQKEQKIDETVDKLVSFPEES